MRESRREAAKLVRAAEPNGAKQIAATPGGISLRALSDMPMLNVFHRDGETIRHFWGAELTYAPADPGQDHRSVGTLEPLWNLFDLTREGRPMDWDEQLSY